MRGSAPRLGIVYDPRGQGREVIRAATRRLRPAGEFHHIRSASVAAWGSLITLNNVSLSDPLLVYPGGNPFPLPVDKNATSAQRARTGRSSSRRTRAHAAFNVSFQQQYAENWSLTRATSAIGPRTSGTAWRSIRLCTPPTPRRGTPNQRRSCISRIPDQGKYFASVTSSI